MTDNNVGQTGSGDSRWLILKAAERVFAEHGFEGARVDAIAAEAGYNKSLLYQYFGDKVGLYTAVLRQADEEAAELNGRVFAPLLTSDLAALSPAQMQSIFTNAFQAVFDYLLVRPQFLRILMWEMASGWQIYAQVITRMQLPQLAVVDTFFARAREAGVIRSGFNPAIQLTLALQICQTYLSSLPFYQLMQPDIEMTSPEAVAEARQFVVSFITAGILTEIN